MKRDIKDLWVSALVSGEFKQVKGQLERDGGYCALGVLSLLAMSEGICSYDYIEKRYGGKKLALTQDVMVWAGIGSNNKKDKRYLEKGAGLVKITVNDRNTTIMNLNDDDGLSFKEIAGLIETNWKKL